MLESCLVSDWKRPVVLRATRNTIRRTPEAPVACLLSHWLFGKGPSPAQPIRCPAGLVRPELTQVCLEYQSGQGRTNSVLQEEKYTESQGNEISLRLISATCAAGVQSASTVFTVQVRLQTSSNKSNVHCKYKNARRPGYTSATNATARQEYFETMTQDFTSAVVFTDMCCHRSPRLQWKKDSRCVNLRSGINLLFSLANTGDAL